MIGLFDGDPVASIPRADLVDVCSRRLRPQELLMMRCSRYFVIRVLNMCGKAVEYSVTIGFVHILQRPQHGNLDRVTEKQFKLRTPLFLCSFFQHSGRLHCKWCFGTLQASEDLCAIKRAT